MALFEATIRIDRMEGSPTPANDYGRSINPKDERTLRVNMVELKVQGSTIEDLKTRITNVVEVAV